MNLLLLLLLLLHLIALCPSCCGVRNLSHFPIILSVLRILYCDASGLHVFCVALLPILFCPLSSGFSFICCTFLHGWFGYLRCRWENNLNRWLITFSPIGGTCSIRRSRLSTVNVIGKYGLLPTKAIFIFFCKSHEDIVWTFRERFLQLWPIRH